MRLLGDRRFPGALYRVGSDPDPRFSLANERTFLAWLRTALALIAGGVALEALALNMDPDLRLVASWILVVAGTLIPVQAWWGWLATERALRLGRPLPSAVIAVPTAVAIVAAGIVVLLALGR